MAVAMAVAVAVAMAEAVAIPCLLTSKSVDEIQGIIHAYDGRHRRISSVTAACPRQRVLRAGQEQEQREEEEEEQEQRAMEMQ